MNLLFALRANFELRPIGEVLLSENLYALSPGVRLAPDAAVILGNRTEELRDAKIIHVIPELCVEVLAPSETPGRIHRKLRQYFAAGVQEIWLVDPDTASVEIWTRPHLPEQEISGEQAIEPSAGVPTGASEAISINGFPD
jgi:Uma2 family endonuclease